MNKGKPQIRLYISEEVVKEMKDYCKKNGMSLSFFAEIVFKKELERRKKDELKRFV